MTNDTAAAAEKYKKRYNALNRNRINANREASNH